MYERTSRAQAGGSSRLESKISVGPDVKMKTTTRVYWIWQNPVTRPVILILLPGFCKILRTRSAILILVSWPTPANLKNTYQVLDNKSGLPTPDFKVVASRR